MVKDVINKTEEKMKATLDALSREYDSMRTGRASSAVLDSVKVDAYGTETPLQGVATLSVPEARLLVIQPWDKGLIGAIEKAILSANLGFNPSNDGKVIRIAFPPLSKERRAELSKEAAKMAEDHKVTIRNIRRDSIDEVKKLEKDKTISEDERKDAENKIQKLTDNYTSLIVKLADEKEKSRTTLG